MKLFRLLALLLAVALVAALTACGTETGAASSQAASQTSSRAVSAGSESASSASSDSSAGDPSQAQSEEGASSVTASAGPTVYAKVTYDVASAADKFRVGGRTMSVTAPVSGKKAMIYDHAGQGFFFNADCEGDVSAQIEMMTSDAENKRDLSFSVRVDGTATRVTLDGSAAWQSLTLPIAKGLTRSVHTFEIYRCNEAVSGLVDLVSVTLTGAAQTYQAPQRALKMVVLGDSITSGSQLDGKSKVNEGKNILSDCTRSYGFLCAEMLNADFVIASRSGSYAAKDDTPNSIYYTYDYVSKRRDDTRYDNAGESDVDVYVISLGTNDNNKKNNQYIFTEQQVRDNIRALITRVRADHPNASIVWTYGQLSTARASVIRGAVEEMMAGDAKLFYYQYKKADNTGGAYHPTAASHARDAQELADFLRDTVLK